MRHPLRRGFLGFGEAGASTRMSRTTKAMLSDVVRLGLPKHFNHTEPDSVELVMNAIVEARK